MPLNPLRYKMYLSEPSGPQYNVISGFIQNHIYVGVWTPDIGADPFAVGDLIYIKGFNEFSINGNYKIISKLNSSGVWLYQLDIPMGQIKYVLEEGTAQKMTITRECYPLNFDKLSLKDERESGYIFYRKKLSGKILFTNKKADGIPYKDFDYLYGIETSGECRDVYIKIDERCGKTYQEVWRGKFSTKDAEIHVDKCFFEVQPNVVDKYTCILEHGDIEYNILEQTNVQSTTYTEPEDFEDIVCSENQQGLAKYTMSCGSGWITSPSNYTGGGLGAPFVNAVGCLPSGQYYQLYRTSYKLLHWDTGTYQVVSIWRRQAKVTFDVGGVAVPPPGAGWVNFGATTLAGLPATKWVRTPYNGAATTYSNAFTCDGWTHITVEYPSSPTQVYNRGRILLGTVKWLAQNSCPGISQLQSLFFGYNQIGAGTNYVTGMDNKITRLTISQKSDIKFPNSTQPATIGKWSFLKAMEVLKVMFNAWWDVDDTGKIKLEHLSHYAEQQGLDLTQGKWAKYINGHHHYTYERQEMPSREVFRFMEAANMDFRGEPIRYPQCASLSAESKEKLYVAELITTDLDYIKTAFEEIANEGFVIFCNDLINGNLHVNSEQGLLSGFVVANGHLSWANLQENYHTYGRLLKNGIMNKKGRTFDSTIKTRKQVRLSRLPICCNDGFEPSQLIKTQMGWGEVKLSETSLLGEYTSLDLLFGDPCIEQVVEKAIIGTMVDDAEQTWVNWTAGSPGERCINFPFNYLGVVIPVLSNVNVTVKFTVAFSGTEPNPQMEFRQKENGITEVIAVIDANGTYEIDAISDDGHYSWGLITGDTAGCVSNVSFHYQEIIPCP